MTMKFRREPTLTISEQAAQWLVVLMEADAEKTAAFISWLKQSPRHVEEFLFATATWQQLCRLNTALPIDLEAILAEVRAAAGSNVVALPTATSVTTTHNADQIETSLSPSGEYATATQRRRMRWVASIAVLGLMTLLTWLVLGSGPVYSTDIGEQRTVRLEDGSVMYLNTETKARVRFTANHRDIELLEGEALFVVAHNTERPFRVRTHDAVVQAVGTQFNVRRHDRDTQVSVVEGRVKLFQAASLPDTVAPALPSRSTGSSDHLMAATLDAGEGATIADTGQVNKRSDIDIVQAVAWRERRLVFRADRLEDVITELNRYNIKHFRIEGNHAKETRLTATFDVDKPESLVTFLQRYSNLTVDEHGDEFVIRPQPGEQPIP